MKTVSWSQVIWVACLTAILSTSAHAQTGRERIRFDAGWRFQLDRVASTPSTNVTWSYKPVTDVTLESATPPTGDDDGWKPAKSGQDLFHNRNGFAWVRTTLAPSARKDLVAHFDGVDDNGVVFLNGQKLLTHRGYDESFDVNLSKAWKLDGPNEIYVLVENTAGRGGLTGGFSVLPRSDAEKPPAMIAPSFNDSSWRHVHLPHDFVVEGTFTPTADAGHGSLPVSTASYRKSFWLPNRYKNKSVWIEFDGVYRNSTVWLNGHKLGTTASGYTGFRYDLSRWAKFNDVNVLAVRVDATRPEGWWYEGGGIYRHVWLNAAERVHIVPDSIFVRTVVHGPEGQLHPSVDVNVDLEVENDSDHAVYRSVESSVEPSSRNFVVTVSPKRLIPAYSKIAYHYSFPIREAKLWSVDAPNLYTLETAVMQTWNSAIKYGNPEFLKSSTIYLAGGVDSEKTTFGVRTLRWDPNKGFFLNGKPFKIKGTCNHQDHAGVGIAVPDSLQYWRIAQLKKMGSNAYRMSHNPPAKELLDACDKLGMIVMDENRHLGDTEQPKTPRGTKYDDLFELKSLIRRDRNHPSVVMWSLCNEETLQGDPEGGKIFAAMQDVARKLDPTRPYTSAMSGGWSGGIAIPEDLLGVNYSPGVYDTLHKKYPNKPMFGSETASTVSTRGIYETDRAKGYVSAYDLNAPSWAQTAEVAWEPIAERPWMAGGYIWTGFDYKGEPTPYEWPCINSHFGIMDICGFPKDNYYYYQAWWGDKPLVHILPHWNWAGKEGTPIDVWCYTNGDSVELFLNGTSLGLKQAPKYRHVQWSVPYQPGTLVAKSYKDGKLFATDTVSTTGAPVAIRLRTDRTSLTNDGEDLTQVNVEVLDAQGRVVPFADNLIQFSVTGAATISGVGNGDPSSHEPDKASSRHAFNGLCMVLVGSREWVGKAKLVASSPGLRGASLDFSISH